MRLPLALVFVLTAISLSSCGRVDAGNSRPAGWPPVLRYNVSIGTEDPSARAKRGDLIKAYLEQQLGIPVEITASVGYGGVIEAMRAKKIEAAGLGPFAYLI